MSFCQLSIVSRLTTSSIAAIWSPINNTNLSGDEIANVNYFKDDIAHVLQNTKKREPTVFNKLDDS